MWGFVKPALKVCNAFKPAISEFAMSSWVLCGKSIVNNSDKHLADGQESSTFNVPEELLSLESRVAIDSTYICRNWLLTKEKNGASDKSSCA